MTTSRTEVRKAALDALSSVAVLAGGVDDAVFGLVSNARRDGATWADIGAALGITRQAAHARYARSLPDLEDDGEAPQQ